MVAWLNVVAFAAVFFVCSGSGSDWERTVCFYHLFLLKYVHGLGSTLNGVAPSGISCFLRDSLDLNHGSQPK